MTYHPEEDEWEPPPPTYTVSMLPFDEPGAEPVQAQITPEMAALAVVELALRSRVPWSAIAASLDLPDKRAAKRRYRELKLAVKLQNL